MFHIYRIFFIFLTVESNDAPTDQESNEGYKTENVCAGSVFDRSPMDHAGLVLYRKMARKNKHWSTKKLFGKNIKNNAGICFHIIPCPEEIRRKQDSGCVSIVFSLYNAPNSRTHVTWWKRKGPLPSFFLYKKKMRVQLALVSKIDTKKLPFFLLWKGNRKNKRGEMESLQREYGSLSFPISSGYLCVWKCLCIARAVISARRTTGKEKKGIRIKIKVCLPHFPKEIYVLF